VFLFASADQRRSLMGAAHTSIAKPWRREIYLESDEYPHPVIRHELVHAIAGEIGRGPFRIAGGYGGWLPDPGLIEGIAEAAAPRDDELGASEWAAAMRKLGILPRLESLFGLGFFAGAGSTSYTTAGSFVSFVRDRHGPLAIARWYGGEPLAAVTGKSLAQLESEWWAMLDGVPLGDAALAEARLRFDRPGVLGRSCPHVVDRLLGEAAGAEGGDPSRGLSLYHQVLALDPSSGRALFGVASCHDRAGDSPAAEQALAALTESPVLPLAARASASEKLGDLALRAGDVARARKHHEAAQAVMVQEDRLRTLDIKLAYAAQPLAREAIVALLIGRDKNGPNVTEALDRIGRWRGADDHDGTPDYLFARQHFNAKNYALAAARLDDALSRSLALPRVLAEALRLRIRAACALGDGVTASRMLDRFRHLTVVSPRRKQAMAALVARCSAEPIVDRR
jgi:Tfp pilus assembly protein PilF